MVNHQIRIGTNLCGVFARWLRRRPIHPPKPAVLGSFEPSVLPREKNGYTDSRPLRRVRFHRQRVLEPIRHVQEIQSSSALRGRSILRVSWPPLQLSGRRFWIGTVTVVLFLFLAGACDLLRRSKPESAAQEQPSEGSTYIPIPMGISDELQNSTMPLLRVEQITNSSKQLVPVPYFYGYPFYGSVEAKMGIYRFREDVWTGYLREESVDEDGVTFLTEIFPEVDCSFQGILETKEKYIPMYLECMLPPPNNMGGRKRPVIGDVMVGATPQQILDEPSIKKAFLGDWHAVTPGFEDGNGTGYFNTEHGQLGFAFKGGKLHRIVYMFDPPVKLWRAPEIWITR